MNKDLEKIALTYKIDEYLYNIYNLLECFFSDKEHNFINNQNINFDTIKKEVKNIFDEYFKLKNIIYYPQKISHLPIIKQIQINDIKRNYNLITPFDINIKEEHSRNYIYVKNIIINNKKYTITNDIHLIKNNIIREIYAHEITHTQINYSSEENFYFVDELLPIFMERFIGEQFNNNNIIYTRLYYLYKDISDIISNKNKIDDELNIYRTIDRIKYIESTLKAYYLYFIYQNEPLSSNKANIIDNINNIFNNTMNIENLLNKYNISNNNYKDLTIIKKLLK